MKFLYICRCIYGFVSLWNCLVMNPIYANKMEGKADLLS